MEQACLAIEEWKVERLRLCNFYAGENHRPLIVTDILHIKFMDLLTLNLALNSIQTIENIQRLMMPKLQEIYLCKN